MRLNKDTKTSSITVPVIYLALFCSGHYKDFLMQYKVTARFSRYTTTYQKATHDSVVVAKRGGRNNQAQDIDLATAVGWWVERVLGRV